MKHKTKLIMLTIGFIIIAMVVSITIAFYSNRGGSIDNVLTTKSSSVYIEELFNPKDNWLAGETKQKELKFGNQGERSQVIRFRIETQWLNSDGELFKPITNTPVEIKWAEALAEEWSVFTDDDGWYYYENVLPVAGETAAIMEGVEFSTSLSNDRQVEDFTHTTYQIIVYMESLSVDSTITQAKWGKTFTEDEGLIWQD